MGNSIFKDLEPNDKVPEYLKKALISEVDTIRNTMQIITHFTKHLLTSISICLSVDDEVKN